MTDRISEDGILSRRSFLKDVGIALASTSQAGRVVRAIGGLLAPPEQTWTPNTGIQRLLAVRTALDARDLAYTTRELVAPDTSKYSFDSTLADRPHLVVVAEKADQFLFKRVVLGYSRPAPTIDYFVSLNGDPPYTITGPDFYGIADLAAHNSGPEGPDSRYEGVTDTSTICQALVYPNQGKAVVINKYVQVVQELLFFTPGISIEEYLSNFPQGDYTK